MSTSPSGTRVPEPFLRWCSLPGDTSRCTRHPGPDWSGVEADDLLVELSYSECACREGLCSHALPVCRNVLLELVSRPDAPTGGLVRLLVGERVFLDCDLTPPHALVAELLGTSSLTARDLVLLSFSPASVTLAPLLLAHPSASEDVVRSLAVSYAHRALASAASSSLVASALDLALSSLAPAAGEVALGLLPNWSGSADDLVDAALPLGAGRR